MADSPSPEASAPPVASRAEEALRLLRHVTRVPLPVLRFEHAPHAAPDLARAGAYMPLAGVLVGSVAALTGLVAYLFGISTTLAATLSIGAGVLASGALHEHHLARTGEALLARPTAGVALVALSLLIRVLALSDLFRLVGPAALLLLLGVATLSRALALAAPFWLPAEQSQPALPDARQAGLAMLLALGFALACAFPAEQLAGMALSALAALMAVYGVSKLAAGRAGSSGDAVFGTAEQIAEMVLLVGLSAAATAHGPV